MPTYTLTNSNFNLSSKQQKNLAEGITKVHNIVTEADNYFANGNKVFIGLLFLFLVDKIVYL